MDNTNTTGAEGRVACRRCGDCCRKGGPALHLEDAELLSKGMISLDHLFTLRPGEPARDQVLGVIRNLEEEVVRIKPAAQGVDSCRFLAEEASSCTIYGDHPLECRLLFCEDTEALSRAYDKDRLSRLDVLGRDHPLAELVASHEENCPAGRAVELARAMARQEKADREGGEEMARMLRFDAEVRRLVAERSTQAAGWLDFLFGRPLAQVFSPLGIRVEEGPEGFRLLGR